MNNLEQQIINAYYNDYEFFFSKPNVEGIGFGYKYIKGICTCEPSIHVFVNKKVQINYLDNNVMIPSIYKGIKTDVIETGSFIAGEFDTMQNNNQCLNTCNKNNLCKQGPLTVRIRPIRPGYCVSIGDDPSVKTGTFGYIVTDNEQVSKTYCLLSNTITFAQCNKRCIGTPIIQPSREYEGKVAIDLVARLLRSSVIKFQQPSKIEEFNIVDAAIANLVNKGEIELINPSIPEIGVPRGVTDVSLLQSIQWTGCISGNQKGSIVSIKDIIKVNYIGCGVAYFKDIILSAGAIATVGDRGALVCDLNKLAVGLIFATNVNKSYNVICSVKNIQEQLNVTLLTLIN